MKLLDKFILFGLVFLASFVTNCSTPKPIKEINYEDDYLYIECHLFHFYKSEKAEETYAEGEIYVKNQTHKKNIIFNLENLYLVAGQDTSNIIALPSDPVTKVILDEIYRPLEHKNIKIYWIFCRYIPDEYLDSL
jgi:hypothetical protein